MIAQAELLLPAEQRARVQQERKEAALNQRIEALRAQGGNDETIRSLRTELYGAQEAQRLAMVDQEHAAWMQRLQNYRNAKDGILRQSALSAQAKDLMVKDLERSQFSGPLTGCMGLLIRRTISLAMMTPCSAAKRLSRRG